MFDGFWDILKTSLLKWKGGGYIFRQLYKKLGYFFNPYRHTAGNQVVPFTKELHELTT